MNQQQTTENKQDQKLHSPSKLVKANEHVHNQDHPLMQAQNLIGNHGVLQRYGLPVIQAKLKIGEPNDVYEQEADRVADAVMRMPDPQVQRKSPWNEDEEDPIQMKQAAGESATLVQRKSPWNEDEEDPIQMKSRRDEDEPIQMKSRREEDEDDPVQMKNSKGQTSQVLPKIESQIRSMKGGGEPLPHSVRDFFEPRFGADFSNVRIHSDPATAHAARSIHAEAFTMGHDIAFSEGRYQPGTKEGRTLLAHELTHVVQKNGGMINNFAHGKLKNQIIQNTNSKLNHEILKNSLINHEIEGPIILQKKKKDNRTISRRVKTDLTKEDIANTIQINLIDYRTLVNTGIEEWNPPEESSSNVWFFIALGGNLVWAATCLVNPMAGAIIKAMSFGGSIIGSGTVEKLLAQKKGQSGSLKSQLKNQVASYVDHLKQNMSDITDHCYYYFKLRHSISESFRQQYGESESAGYLDAGEKILERRKFIWNNIFDGKVAPWDNSAAIIPNTIKEIGAIWNRFKILFEARILNIYGTGLRFTGVRQQQEIMKIYYQSLVESGVADRSPAVKVSDIWKDYKEFKVYEFPAPGPNIMGAKVSVPTGKEAIPIELR